MNMNNWKRNKMNMNKMIIVVCLIVLIGLLLLITGCSGHRQIINKYEGATAQEIMSCSIIGALDNIADKIKNHNIQEINILSYYITNLDNQEYINQYLISKLNSLNIKTNNNSNINLKLFINTSGTDYSKNSFGIPSIPVPMTGMSTPELNLLSSDKFHAIFNVKYFIFNGNDLIDTNTTSNICYTNNYNIIFIPLSENRK